MLMEESQWRRMVCEVVSKASLFQSRRMRVESKPESAEMRISEVIFNRAVSVLWRGQKPDGKGS